MRIMDRIVVVGYLLSIIWIDNFNTVLCLSRLILVVQFISTNFNFITFITDLSKIKITKHFLVSRTSMMLIMTNYICEAINFINPSLVSIVGYFFYTLYWECRQHSICSLDIVIIYPRDLKFKIYSPYSPAITHWGGDDML